MAAESEIQVWFEPVLEWLSKYVNAHRFLWFMSLVCFLIAWNRGIALLYGLLALMLSLIIISWVMPWWVLQHLSISRHQQELAYVGEKIRLCYRFTANRPIDFLRIGENIPGSEELTQEEISHFLAAVEKDQSIVLTYPVLRRGEFLLPPPVLTCSWPFGFVERKANLCQPETLIVVAPKIFPIRALPILLSDNPQMVGVESFLERHSHSEFAGVRPFREGDSLKHIHWSASARHQQMIVREYHSYDNPSWLIIVDGEKGSAVGEGADTTFEYAVSIAASLIRYAQQHFLKLKVVVGGKLPLILNIQSGVRDVTEMLKSLARVKDNGEETYQQLITATLLGMKEKPVVITIRRDSQSLLIPEGYGYLDIVYNQESFSKPMKHYPEGWRNIRPGVQQLQLHRLSDLHQVFAL